MLNDNEIENVVSQIMSKNKIYKNLSLQKYYIKWFVFLGTLYIW